MMNIVIYEHMLKLHTCTSILVYLISSIHKVFRIMHAMFREGCVMSVAYLEANSPWLKSITITNCGAKIFT